MYCYSDCCVFFFQERCVVCDVNLYHTVCCVVARGGAVQCGAVQCGVVCVVLSKTEGGIN
jgi:hypothetical protein